MLIIPWAVNIVILKIQRVMEHMQYTNSMYIDRVCEEMRMDFISFAYANSLDP